MQKTTDKTPKFKAEIPRVPANKTNDLTPSMRRVLTKVHEQMMEPEQRIAPMAMAILLRRMKQTVQRQCAVRRFNRT